VVSGKNLPEEIEPSASPIEVVLKFEQMINSRNPDAVCTLLTEDLVFIGFPRKPRSRLGESAQAWAGYFKMVQDYSISHSEIFANGVTVAVFGSAQGTFSNSKDGQMKKEDFWKTPSAWRAVIKDGKIAVWQVFADNEPIRAVMRRYSGSA
jgi:ketosteroid isomerase-like protein